MAAAARLISDDLLDRFAFAGDADDIIRQAEALYAAGASRVEFRHAARLPSAKVFGCWASRFCPL